MRYTKALSRKSMTSAAVAEKIERTLGIEALKVCTATSQKSSSTSQGEKQHHTLDEARYGPDFRMLAEVIVDFGLHPTMICESPILDIDARKMQATLKEVIESRQTES